MQMKEKAVTDSGERQQGRGGEMEARRETEAGNPAGVPSTSASSAAGSQPQPGEGRRSCCHAGCMTQRPSNQSVTAGQNRTCLNHVQLCLFILDLKNIAVK